MGLRRVSVVTYDTRRIKGDCNKGAIFRGVYFRVRRESEINLAKEGKDKGAALFGLLTKTRIPSANGVR